MRFRELVVSLHVIAFQKQFHIQLVRWIVQCGNPFQNFLGNFRLFVKRNQNRVNRQILIGKRGKFSGGNSFFAIAENGIDSRDQTHQNRARIKQHQHAADKKHKKVPTVFQEEQQKKHQQRVVQFLLPCCGDCRAGFGVRLRKCAGHRIQFVKF